MIFELLRSETGNNFLNLGVKFETGMDFRGQAPFVQRADNFILSISRYPANKMYSIESVLSAG